ncbi:MAG: iron-containing redox enzyme family protein [Janthinobacterium lividum]
MRTSSRALYFDLMDNGEPAANAQVAERVREFLETQLEAARQQQSDLPADMQGLSQWIVDNNEQVGQAYRNYLAARKAGGPRQYFSNKSHALYFLQTVAPTKLVDGAWLYGMLAQWRDARFTSLIKIYLEELGEGVPGKNHVALYKRLLADNGCEHWHDLGEEHFVQGAIQLALANSATDFLPEIIGFNLGYEQLPLHLLITSYELNELGIDPYYFTLHVTVDNADTGHAQKSLLGLLDAMPRVGDPAVFYQRVIDGYKLNMLGASTDSVIKEFDLEAEVIAMFQKKSVVGKHAHSDYCRVAGKSITDWLSDPQQMGAFLQALIGAGWIKRFEDPQNSRFWHLIEGERAEMFGVFTSYEQQLIRDWIVGTPEEQRAHLAAAAENQEPSASTYRPARAVSWKAMQRLQSTLGSQHETAKSSRSERMARGLLRRHHQETEANAFSQELRTLEQELAMLPGRDAAMDRLTPLMSPTHHHTAAGMMATRIFTSLLG